MGMVVLRQDDPRDNLRKMGRDELRDLGRTHGIELPADMPAFDDTSNPVPNMVATLRAAGIRGPDMSHRVLGSTQPTVYPPPASYSNKLLPKAPPPEPSRPSWREQEEPPTIEKMTMGQLKKEAKRRGLVIPRTDKKPAILEKLREQNAS